MSHDPALLAARLLTDGYCIIRDVCAPATICALEDDFVQRFVSTPFCEVASMARGPSGSVHYCGVRRIWMCWCVTASS
jgi:hypothetical protein